MKKKLLSLLLIAVLLLGGCAEAKRSGTVLVCTTNQLAELTATLLSGTEAEKTAQIAAVVSEPVSCVHDYTLSVEQMKLLESADALITVGLGFEDFMGSALQAAKGMRITASDGVAALTGEEGTDPHIWLSPENCKCMADTVCAALCGLFPQDGETIAENTAAYCASMDELLAYGKELLAELSCRELVTFHDGFSYFASAFDLTVAAAMELEPGSEPSAKELEQIIQTVREGNIPAVFAEQNGTADAAELVAAETGAAVAYLDMGLSGGDAIRRNLDTVKEVLG